MKDFRVGQLIYFRGYVGIIIKKHFKEKNGSVQYEASWTPHSPTTNIKPQPLFWTGSVVANESELLKDAPERKFYAGEKIEFKDGTQGRVISVMGNGEVHVAKEILGAYGSENQLASELK